MNWANDLERYARLLRNRDSAHTIRFMEICNDRLNSIRNTYPNQQKIFDIMEREQ